MKKPTAIVVFALLLGLFVLLLVPRALHVHELERRSANLEKELVQLRRENEKLGTELKLLHDDPVYLEKVARQKFNKAKEGEIVYKVVREGENTRRGTTDRS